MTQATKGVFSFRCTACGKCCNSPPLLSLPELFRFEHVFIGCLAVRGGPAGPRVTVQGYDFDDLPCPALQADHGCSLHETGKPAMCQAVPLDPLAADAMQHAVLEQRRRDAAYLAADCIVEGEAEGYSPLVHGSRVADAQFVRSLDRHRASAAADQRFWGDAVSRMLAQEALPVSTTPVSGFVALPLTPVLTRVAAFSDACRRRCIVFIEAQRVVIRSAVLGALSRRRLADRPMTQRLRGWSRIYQDFATVLDARPHDGVADARAEAWLGLDMVGA